LDAIASWRRRFPGLCPTPFCIGCNFMETLQSILEARLRAAVSDVTDLIPQVQAAADRRFGDYQTNIAMVLAKQQKSNPRQLAQSIVERLEVSDISLKPEIAGAGFINFRVRTEVLEARMLELAGDRRCGVGRPERVRKIVVDFSSPNVAKPMHVGHIRSTILGDAIGRIAAFLGHEVVRDNHIGDWGTQFGMLLLGWKQGLDAAALAADPLSEMERIYKWVSARCKEDPSTLEAAREELVRLQAGDEENLGLWREMIRLSQVQFDTIYGRLGVRFDFCLGESFYNSRLKGVVQALRERQIARESEGAYCVFSDGVGEPEGDPFLVRDKEGWRPNPALVQKSDGAANYTTTDLATLEYRMEQWAPDEVIYVTDGRQQLHFRQLFAIFRRWQPEAASKVRLAHVWFGSILGDDGKPFKTRSGETVRLSELLDEAEERAGAILAAKNPELSQEERGAIARAIGLGAVKYADLLPNRQSDYVFSWDRMLSFQGNTAPYLQNAYVRIRSIFRKGGVEAVGAERVELREAAEKDLALKLLQFGEALSQVMEDYRPNLLANYLFELADTFHAFYEACPVLKAEGVVRGSRMLLCENAARVLQQGLGLLGIELPERM
jgi:arginyl-tRNA synthetase